MSSVLLLSIVFAYYAVLLGVAWYTSRNANNDSFFIGNRSSNWMLVAFGMVLTPGRVLVGTAVAVAVVGGGAGVP